MAWDGSGRVTNAGSLTINGGITFQGTSLDNLAGAMLNVSGIIGLQGSPDAVVTNAGTITSTNTDNSAAFYISNGQFYNKPTGTLTMSNGGLRLASPSPNAIRNEGTVTVKNVETYENSTFDNYKQVSVSGNWANTGVLNTYPGSTTAVTGNYTQNNKIIAESVTNIGGRLTVGGIFFNDGKVRGYGGITVGGLSTNTSNGTIASTNASSPRLDFCDASAGAGFLFDVNQNAGQDNRIPTNGGNTNRSGVTMCLYAVCAAASPASISGPTSPCFAPIANVTYSVAAVTGATDYAWTIPTGWTFVGASSGTTRTNITVTPGSGSGAVTVTVTASSCSPATSRGYANLFVAPVPAAPATPGTIAGPTATSTYCAGLTTQYAISPVTNASSYTWNVPTGWTIVSGQGTPGLTATVGSAGGNVTVTATNTCNTSAAASLAVAAPLTAPLTITGAAAPCWTASTSRSATTDASWSPVPWCLPATGCAPISRPKPSSTAGT